MLQFMSNLHLGSTLNSAFQTTATHLLKMTVTGQLAWHSTQSNNVLIAYDVKNVILLKQTARGFVLSYKHEYTKQLFENTSSQKIYQDLWNAATKTLNK